LRTFSPDRRPLIGPDPEVAGLFHVSGLGGFGAGTSAAVGELAATLLAGRLPEWIDASTVAPDRIV
jgi:glycine/D-amino acid oxidase-like deaminating enzyme